MGYIEVNRIFFLIHSFSILLASAKVRELKYVASSDSIVIGKSLYSTRRLILKIHTGFSVLGK